LLSGDPSPAYTFLHNLQLGEMAIATQHGTINVGTFNAATGFFTGLGGSGAIDLSDLDPPDPNGGGNLGPIMKPRPRPQPQPSPTEALIDSVNVGLIFSVTNTNGGFSVTANNTTVTAGPGQRSLTVEVGTASQVAYKITAGARSYSGQFSIIRPPHVAVATIPVIPIAVIYDSPQGQSGQNKTQLTVTSSLSTTVTLSYTQGSSVQQPTAVVDGGFSEASDFKKMADDAGKVISTLGQNGKDILGQIPASFTNWVSGLVGLDGVLSSLMGSSTATDTTGTTTEKDSSNGLTVTSSGTFSPGTHLGPGDGDLIRYIVAQPIGLIGWGGKVTTTPLPGGQVRQQSVYFLKQRLQALGTSDAPDPLTGLDRQTIQALLALDPLAQGGPDAPLDPSRFAWRGNYGVNGGTDTETITYSATQSQTTSSTQTNEYVQTDKSGWLSFLGIGVADDKTTKVTVTNKTSTKQDSTQTVSATFTLVAGANEYYTVDVYYDNLYGTVLLRKVGPSQVLAPIGGAAASEVGEQPVGVLTAAAPQAKTPATSTSTPRGDVSSAATSAPVQLSIRPMYVVSDPTQLPAIPRSKLVLQDAL
jgi:hypothetical protein